MYNTQQILSRARGIELKPSKSSRTVYNLFRNTQRRIHSAVFFIHIHAGAEETGEGPTHRPGHMAHTAPGNSDSRRNGRRRRRNIIIITTTLIVRLCDHGEGGKV